MEKLHEVQGETLRPRVNRRRVNLNCTVHPDTMTRLDGLCARFVCSRGVVLDKVVNVLDSAYKTGKVYCVHGQVCQIGRTDLPEVL